MALLELRAVELSFGGPALLDNLDFGIDKGERIALIGRNGAGKSSLMKVIDGGIIPESGEVRRDSALKIARLEQDLPAAGDEPVYDVVVDGLPEVAELLHRYHHLVHEISNGEGDLDALSRIQEQLEAGVGWSLHQRVESTLSRMQLDGEAPFSSLSGGLKRRVLLARSLVSEPDLLLLDEPTNHLDIDAIRWLEDNLLGFNGALLFITHDRAFLKRLATRIVELDRGRLLDFPGTYDQFLERRDQALAAEDKANAQFDKKLAEEEAWIRQGIKARRTRNEGRVRALKAMREERSQRRGRQGSAQFSIESAQRSGKLVYQAEGVDFSYSEDSTPIIQGLNALIMRGDKVGLIGPNGVGKSTLLKLILGHLEPQSGKWRLGVNLEVAYFDQSRAQLDMEKSVADNVSGGRDFIELGDARKHIMSYLQDFLFAPDRARQPVKSLSGGERNRLLLARLFSKPSNLLVLDEPTNDLDMETLELLEERLIDYSGTVLLVSHDRDFLDQVVTSSLVFEGEGRVGEYVGGYSDWLRQRPESSAAATVKKESKPAQPASPQTKPAKAKKLSYKDARELEQLPARIETLESELDALHGQFSSAGFYQLEPDKISEAQNRAKEIEETLAELYERWEALEEATGT
ncbi:MAG: ATP-binding cassette domain-containing protein [Gammaproteobacteria bacterium]